MTTELRTQPVDPDDRRGRPSRGRHNGEDPAAQHSTPLPPATGGLTRDRRWLRWGAAVLAADLIVHPAAAALVNDWEGWGAVVGVTIFVLVTGLVVVGVTYGVIVRWALGPRTSDTAVAAAALGTGVASLAGYALIFAWAPVLIAPAALLLAREALSRRPNATARRLALTGGGFGLFTFAVFGSFLVTLALTNNFPFGL